MDNLNLYWFNHLLVKKKVSKDKVAQYLNLSQIELNLFVNTTTKDILTTTVDNVALLQVSDEIELPSHTYSDDLVDIPHIELLKQRVHLYSVFHSDTKLNACDLQYYYHNKIAYTRLNLFQKKVVDFVETKSDIIAYTLMINNIDIRKTRYYRPPTKRKHQSRFYIKEFVKNLKLYKADSKYWLFY